MCMAKHPSLFCQRVVTEAKSEVTLTTKKTSFLEEKKFRNKITAKFYLFHGVKHLVPSLLSDFTFTE